MSGHGGNPIFFHKKIKIGRPEHSLTPHPHLILPYPPRPLKVDVICVSPLNGKLYFFCAVQNLEQS